jgi:L,D-peptidoglycan transpeptidase YkuD (ErfK/YbiS/YcfS/YnhG family)
VALAARRPGSDDRAAFLSAGPLRIRCAIGRTGLTRRKREGDGATPVGRFGVLGWWFQPARPALFRGRLPSRTIRRDDGWCDDPVAGAYNRPVRRPFSRSHEEMWRDDGKYAVVGILDCNITRRRAGAGSAIFFHVCDADYGATAGCVAIRASDFRKLLPLLSARAKMLIV